LLCLLAFQLSLFFVELALLLASVFASPQAIILYLLGVDSVENFLSLGLLLAYRFAFPLPLQCET
jgi:hypothetical protein